MNLPFNLPKYKGLRDDNPRQPYKIVSLWEVLNFYADRFGRISSLLGELSMAPFSNNDVRIRLSRPLLDQLAWLRDLAEQLKLKGPSANVTRLLRDVRSRSATNVQIKRSAHALIQSIIDEFEGELILAVEPARAEYYEVKDTFLGKEVINRLSNIPRLVEESTEAGNCFALGNDTACVFHLMRIMEHCLQALAGSLGFTLAATYDKTWQGIINDVRGALKVKWPKEKDPMRIKHEELLGHLETVKIRWRNQTMHPKATYSEKETRRVMAAVDAFVEIFAKIYDSSES